MPLLVSFPVMLGLPAALIALAVPLPLPLLVVGSALTVIGIVLGNALRQTVVQQEIPNEKLARVFLNSCVAAAPRQGGHP